MRNTYSGKQYLWELSYRLCTLFSSTYELKKSLSLFSGRLILDPHNEALLVENNTLLSWRIYHDYHMLGIVDANEERNFQITKHGTLNVRPLEGENVEYLVLSLNDHIRYVRIYRRHLSKDVEVYDMRSEGRFTQSF